MMKADRSGTLAEITRAGASDRTKRQNRKPYSISSRVRRTNEYFAKFRPRSTLTPERPESSKLSPTAPWGVWNEAQCTWVTCRPATASDLASWAWNGWPEKS